MKLKPQKEILELTNKFLEDFFTLSEKLEDSIAKGRTRNESYYFHYGLADAIGFSDYAVNKRTKHKDFPLITEGACLPGDRICMLLFDLNIEGVFSDLAYSLERLEYQLEDDNRLEIIKNEKKVITFWCHTQNVKLHCTFSDNKILELRLKKDAEVFHKVILAQTMDTTEVKFFGQKEHTEILYWSRHKDINEFYSCLSVVLSEIKDELSDES